MTYCSACVSGVEHGLHDGMLNPAVHDEHSLWDADHRGRCDVCQWWADNFQVGDFR